MEGTPLDFRAPHAIGARINDPDQQMKYGRGYDHNWVLNASAGSLSLAARVHEPASGRVLEVLTTQPGLQFYTGNFLDGTLTGKGGKVYQQRLCLLHGDAAFPRFAESSGFSDLRAEARSQVPSNYGFSLLSAIERRRTKLLYCTNCGSANEPGAQYCTKCGAPLAALTPEPAAPAVPPAAPTPLSPVAQQPGYQPPPGGYVPQPVYPPPPYDPMAKSKLAAGLLGIFLGCFGVHRFYLGFQNIAIAQLAVGVIGLVLFPFTCGLIYLGACVWGLVDGIMILTGSISTDAQGRPLLAISPGLRGRCGDGCRESVPSPCWP